MKAKELMELLEHKDPDSEVGVSVVVKGKKQEVVTLELLGPHYEQPELTIIAVGPVIVIDENMICTQ